MGKYALVQCVNGNFSVVSEHGTEDAGKVAFHNLSAALWNEPEVITARVNLVDSLWLRADSLTGSTEHQSLNQNQKHRKGAKR